MDAKFWWDTVRARRNMREMTWADFQNEFRKKYYNGALLQAHRVEFERFRQGDLSVADAVQRFEQLARLCPGAVLDEEERVRCLMDMFRKDIATLVDSGDEPPQTAQACINRALRAEHRLKQEREERQKAFEARKAERNQQRSNPPAQQ